VGHWIRQVALPIFSDCSTKLGSTKSTPITILWLLHLSRFLKELFFSYWTLTCDKNSLNAYAKSSPTAEDLLNKAEEILFDHITPLPSSTTSELKKLKAERHEAVVDTTQELNKSKKSSKQPAQVLPITGPGPDKLDPDDDVVNQNLCLLLRDILVLIELLSSIRDGDIGRIEDLFPFLIMMFQGAGGTNYSNELLWLVLNLKHVWPPEFAYIYLIQYLILQTLIFHSDIMRDTSLINTHGSPIPVDTNIELAIGKLKVFAFLNIVQSPGCQLILRLETSCCKRTRSYLGPAR
jgi:hypothetical protein